MVLKIYLIASILCLVKAQDTIHPHEVDFIVVGAGAAGAAIASRLSEDGKYDVALLEAGGEPSYVTQIPYMAIGPLKGQHDWNYQSEIQTEAYLGYNVKAVPYPRGRGLGGSTLINGLVYTRGNRKDYDYWASLGNEGWDFDSVLPFFKKLEDYQAPIETEEDRKYHNQGGPMTASRPRYVTEVSDVFHNASVELGLPAIDYNAGSQYGVSYPVFIVRNGTRHSTYDGYLKNARNRKNLHIVTHAFATKIMFNNEPKAIGVKFEKDGHSFTVKARKEIIISGGAFNSPQLLMLSGVGPKEDLQKHNVPLVAHVPGVGRNLQNHPSTIGIYFTIDDPTFGFGPNEINANTMEMWERYRQGPLTNPTRVEGINFFNSKYNTEKDFPDLEIFSFQPPLISPDIDPLILKSVFQPKDFKNIITFCPILMRPKSIGYVTLRSSDPHIHPLIEPKFFTEQEDVDVLVEGVKMALKLANTSAFQKHGLKYHGNEFPQCVELKEGSDKYWECMVRHFSFDLFHPSGTCKMGPDSDPMAVVDSKLRVRGVSGLRVADASIMPRIMTGHPMVPTIMIGEKVAHMILHEYNNERDEL